MCAFATAEESIGICFLTVRGTISLQERLAQGASGVDPLHKEGNGKGADRGVDGLLYFYESKDERHKIFLQVKGGGVKRGEVATLLGDVNNQKAAGGILLTLEQPITTMRLICFIAHRSPVVPLRRSFGTSANTAASAPRPPA